MTAAHANSSPPRCEEAERLIAERDARGWVAGGSFTKIADTGTEHIVTGILADGKIVDKQAERLNYWGSKPHFEALAKEMSDATNGRNVFPLRLMHQPRSIGYFKSIEFDDANEIIRGTAVVTDEDTWAGIKAGQYTGFSCGGSYGARKYANGATTYVALPAECSIVDNPAVGTARFEYVSKAAKPKLPDPKKVWQTSDGRVFDFLDHDAAKEYQRKLNEAANARAELAKMAQEHPDVLAHALIARQYELPRAANPFEFFHNR
jgi:hypothetical protein